ncbi:hypothetical protein IGI04_031523 [Brassica rapa subsp. trilocularis]|uniref:26S proteasome non-ATPase regulatory subunit 2 homolog n=1 Tax=Brassica rapa subsp. trilocularis TaxID=1813537 RepID=A0ABQ7LUJ6_BRACM|nr:hypothetical protein IGI04_031523 [Brassica rapa subsp. trilocularis]
MAPAPDPNSSVGGGGGAKRDQASTKVKAPKKKEEDLSEEDLELQQNLELYVKRVQDPNPELQKAALESMRLAGSGGDIGSWGHEYVRNLAGEVAVEYTIRQVQESSIMDLMDLVRQIVAFHMKVMSFSCLLFLHNAETEAVDLLMEVEDLDPLLDHVGRTNFRRTCNYLTSAAKYRPWPDDMVALDIAYMIYMKFKAYPNALQIALLLDNMQYVKKVFTSCTNLLRKKQFCYMISRHGITFNLDPEMVEDKDDRSMLQEIVNNTKLNEGYLTLARDIDVMEAKRPEDIYKAHLLNVRSGPVVESAKQNLAATFVNAFVNAGFGQDKLMAGTSDSTSGSAGNWIFRNKDDGKTSATASLGMIYLWDVEGGLAQLDKYYDISDKPVRAGALLGVGIVNCGIKSDCDPALALIGEYTDNEDSSVRIGAIMGIGIAYAGSQNDQIKSSLSPILNDEKAPLDVVAFAALSLGMVYVGSCNDEVAQSIMFALMDRNSAEPGEALVRFLPLGLGLLYLGKQESVEATAEISKTLCEKIRNYCKMTLLSCAYAGTGNVLKVQELLAQCGEHPEKDTIHQGPAVLGVAMIAMSEELGRDMAIRSLEHVLQYGEQNIRRAVPLALGLLCISNPKMNVMDTLSRLSHDTDSEVAMTATISLGLIGAGTNNARIAGMLRNLSSYNEQHARLLFCVRIAQGLLHMGKGLLTLNPFHSDRVLLSPTALAGIVTLLHACLDMKSIILGKYHYVLYFLALAMQPRMMLTVDENLKPISVPVRVGQAVDVVGQAGRPRTITGFQTYETPVLLAAGERAELATDKYIPLSPILEGFVILRENPNYREE